MSVNGSNGAAKDDDVVVRKAERGWVVGDENVSDLTSAMVLADLFAADQADSDGTTLMEAVDENGAPRRPARASAPAPRSNHSGAHQMPAVSGAAGIATKTGEADEAARLAVTVAQLEHALAARVRVEQAIGVLAERHRLRPREAFDLLRKASRSRGARVTELAQDVVASTANPLLQLPEELSRALPEPRQRGNRSLRRTRLLAVAIAVPAGRLRP
jgi:ANTAR domain